MKNTTRTIQGTLALISLHFFGNTGWHKAEFQTPLANSRFYHLRPIQENSLFSFSACMKILFCIILFIILLA